MRAFSNPVKLITQHLQNPNNHLVSHSKLRNQTISKFCSLSSANASNELLDYFDHLLLHSSNARKLLQVHTQIFASGFLSSGFLASKLIAAYSRFRLLPAARNVFENMHLHCPGNYLLWNSIIRAWVSEGEYHQAIGMYVRMRKVGVFGDGLTFPLVIRACTLIGDANLCRNVHGHVFCMGLQRNFHVENALINMYGKTGRMSDACKVFDRMAVRNQLSWNTVVSGFAHNLDSDGALRMFRKMESEGWEPNVVTWTSLLSSLSRCGDCRKVMEFWGLMRSRGVVVNAETVAVVLSACAVSGAFRHGELMHGYVVKGGLEDYLFVKNALISMYGKHGNPNSAHRVFFEMEAKNIVTCNALISSYAECGLGDEAFKVFSQLEKSETVRPNVVSWSAVIGGFSLMEKTDESLDLFRKMQQSRVLANSVTICSVLSVCAKLAAFRLGKEIHGHVIKTTMDTKVLVGNSLLNMYAKCGSLKTAYLVFGRITGRDLISWNSLIDGYGIHGFGAAALATFDEMMSDGVTPDGVTFLALLSACGHAGLVNEGRRLFNQMKVFNIEVRMEHYACIVDILGRGGLLQEAIDIVKSMPMVPNECVWGALLHSCRMHRNVEIAEETASRIFKLDSVTTGSYMLMSDIYSSNEQWEDSANSRISARSKGLKKIPGQSWVEVNKSVSVFQAGQALEKGLESVHEILKMLSFKIEVEGYEPNKNFFLPDLEG